jgi:hypothetical protein
MPSSSPPFSLLSLPASFTTLSLSGAFNGSFLCVSVCVCVCVCECESAREHNGVHGVRGCVHMGRGPYRMDGYSVYTCRRSLL